MAQTKVSRGIYALKKKGVLELRNDLFENKTEMMQTVDEWNKRGFVAFWNWDGSGVNENGNT